MKKYTCLFVTLFLVFSLETSFAQDAETAKSKIEVLQSQKSGIKNAEREALKNKVEQINQQLEKGSISREIADQQKKEAAEFHAANIDDRLAILDKKIALLRRNEGVLPKNLITKERRFLFGLGHEYDDRYIGVFFRRKKPKKFKYDKRLYSDLVFSAGFNSTDRRGESIKDQGLNANGGFYELGWAWRYRVFKNTNALRFNFGLIFQHNILDFSNGYYDVNDEGKVQFNKINDDEDDENIQFGRLLTENFVLQFHLETGPSKYRRTVQSIRYSLHKQFRFGFGGFIGVPSEVWQTLSFDPNQPELNEELNNSDQVSIFTETNYDFKTNDFVYGISGYAGLGGLLLYVKYDLSNTFNYEVVRQRNISLGIRLDM